MAFTHIALMTPQSGRGAHVRDLLEQLVQFHSQQPVLRYRSPGTRRPFRVRGTVGRFPVLPALATVAVVGLLTSLDADALVAGTVLLVLGVVAAEVMHLWHPGR